MLDIKWNWTTQYRTHLMLLGILSIAVGFRLYHLNFQSLWLDEIYSMNGSDPSKTVHEVIEYSKTDQPPLYFLLLHTWLKLFSFSDFYGRLLSAGLGIASVVVMFFVGKEFKNTNVGLFAAFITSINYFNIYYSQEVRFYTLLFLTSALSHLFFFLSIKKEKIIYFTGYIIFTASVLYTHYYGLVVFASQGILFLFLMVFYKKSKKLFLSIGLSALIVLVLISPWIPVFFQDSQTESFWIKAPKFYFPAPYFYHYFKDVLQCVIMAALLLTFLFQTFLKEKMKTEENVFLSGWIFLGFAIPFIYSIVAIPMLEPRYTIIVLPAIIICASIGLDHFSFQIRSAVLITLFGSSLVSLFLIHSYYTEPQKQQWREVAETVIHENHPEYIMFSYYAAHYNYYFKSLHYSGRVIHPTSVDYDKELNKVDGVWLLQAHDPGHGATNEEVGLIDRQFKLEKEFEFLHARARLYLRKK